MSAFEPGVSMAQIPLLKKHFQNKSLLLRFELIESIVLFAEGHNGVGSETVALFLTDGNAFFIKSNYTVEAPLLRGRTVDVRQGPGEADC